MRMVDSQYHSSSDWASMDGTGDEKEEKAKAPGLVPTCWGYPEAYSYPKANICIPKKIVLQKSRQLLAVVKVAPFFLLIAECPTIRVRSELCRTEILTQSTSATVLG